MTAKEVLIILQQRLADKHRSCRSADIATDQTENYIEVKLLTDMQAGKLGITASVSGYTQFFIAIRSLMGNKLFDFIGVNDINSVVDIISPAFLSMDADIENVLGQ
jgi:hypothetical protein